MNSRTTGEKIGVIQAACGSKKSTGPRTTSEALTLKSDLENVKQVN